MQQILALIAIPSTLILLVQTVMVIMGFEEGGDGGDLDGDGLPDGDVEDGGVGLFSVRGIVGMLCVMGWSGVILLDAGINTALALSIALVLGILTLILLGLLMRGVYKLQSSGNVDLGNAIGKVGQVYIPVPGKGASSGKISIMVQEKLIECDAITTCEETLKTGSYVRVVGISDAGVLLVEPVAKP